MSRKNPQIRIRTNKKPLKSEEQPAKSKKKKNKRAEKTHGKNHHREKRVLDWGEGEDERLAKENREF